MQLTATAPTNPGLAAAQPADAVRQLALDELEAARSELADAHVATSATDGVRPEQPFWSHRAMQHLGAARAHNDAAAAAFELADVAYDRAPVNSRIDEATYFLTEAVDRHTAPFGPMLAQASREASRGVQLLDAAIARVSAG